MGLLSLVAVVLFVFGTIMTGCRVHGYSEDFITWDDFSVRQEEDQYGKFDAGVTQKKGVIVVAKDGTGDSVTVQGGVDMVPHENKERVKIVIRPGVYRFLQLIPSIYIVFFVPHLPFSLKSEYERFSVVVACLVNFTKYKLLDHVKFIVDQLFHFFLNT